MTVGPEGKLRGVGGRKGFEEFKFDSDEIARPTFGDRHPSSQTDGINLSIVSSPEDGYSYETISRPSKANSKCSASKQIVPFVGA
jgi:hypothetical protein